MRAVAGEVEVGGPDGGARMIVNAIGALAALGLSLWLAYDIGRTVGERRFRATQVRDLDRDVLFSNIDTLAALPERQFQALMAVLPAAHVIVLWPGIKARLERGRRTS